MFQNLGQIGLEIVCILIWSGRRSICWNVAGYDLMMDPCCRPISKWRNFLFIASDCDSDLSVNTMINNFNLPSPSPNAVMDIIHDASSLKSSQH